MTTTPQDNKGQAQRTVAELENIQALTKEIQELYCLDSIPLFWATRAGRIQPQYCSLSECDRSPPTRKTKTIHVITTDAGRESYSLCLGTQPLERMKLLLRARATDNRICYNRKLKILLGKPHWRCYQRATISLCTARLKN